MTATNTHATDAPLKPLFPDEPVTTISIGDRQWTLSLAQLGQLALYTEDFHAQRDFGSVPFAEIQEKGASLDDLEAIGNTVRQHLDMCAEPIDFSNGPLHIVSGLHGKAAT